MDKAGYTFLIEKYELRVLEPLVHCFALQCATSLTCLTKRPISLSCSFSKITAFCHQAEGNYFRNFPMKKSPG